MPILPVHYTDFKSLLKTLLSPPGGNRPTTMNEAPDVEQARRQELDHRHRHRQQQQFRGGEGTNSITCQQHPIMLTITKAAAVILNVPQNPSRHEVLPDLYPFATDL